MPRNDCDAHVERVHEGLIYQKADLWADAIALYSLAYNNRTIEAIPIANGTYDIPHFTIPSPNRRSDTGQFNLPQPGPCNHTICPPHKLHLPHRIGVYFYIVIWGEEVGIFGSWYVFLL